MNRIAILSDIHANLFALRAVHEDLERLQPDEILVGGDLVGRGPQGDDVVKYVTKHGWPSVRGNHEDYLLNFHHRRVPASWWQDPVWSASRWMVSELSATSLAIIESLAMELRPERDGGILLVHGTPRSNQEGFGSWTAPEVLDEIAEMMRPGEMLVGAHTHRPIELERGGIRLVNTGSVGLPFNGDWRAQYVIITTHGDGTRSVEFRQVEYDREAFLRHYKTSGFYDKGGITSAMLYQEILHARPFLVPYLRWCEAMNKNLCLATTEEFLELYDCNMTMAELVEQFRNLGVTRLSGKEEMEDP